MNFLKRAEVKSESVVKLLRLNSRLIVLGNTKQEWTSTAISYFTPLSYIA